MIGGGGSTANRAAAEVIGVIAGRAGARGGVGAGRAPKLGLARLARGGGAIGRGAKPATGATPVVGALGAAPASSSFSLIPLSTNWLIEIPLVSQNALSRSYALRLTLMLRRVC